MTGRRSWLVLGVLMAIVAILVVAHGSNGGDSPEHSSSSDAANGTSALRLYAAALGHPVGTLDGSFTLPASPGLLFVFSPIRGYGFNGAEAGLLRQWVLSGGVLIYATEAGEPQLDQVFGVGRNLAGVPAAALSTAPLLGGVTQVVGTGQAAAFQPAPSEVPLLRNRRGDILAVLLRLGRGQVLALADPLELCNVYLRQADNGRFAADLLALSPAGGRVLFDEYHHGVVAGDSSPTAWLLTPWGVAIAWAVLAVFAGLVLRGGAFGPLLPLGSALDRSSAEHTTAVGALLRRAAARVLTLQALAAATRHALAERVGLSRSPTDDGLAAALERRAPALGAALVGVEQRLAEGGRSEATFLSVARELHALAYPSGAQSSGRKPS